MRSVSRPHQDLRTIITIALNKFYIVDAFLILSMVHYGYHRKDYRYAL